METYGKILLIAIPAFLLLVLFEMGYSWRKEKKTMRTNDTISSLLSGVTNITKDVLGLSIIIYSYSWMVQHWALLHIKASWLTYAIAFIVLDFSGYCVHRIQHQFNFSGTATWCTTAAKNLTWPAPCGKAFPVLPIFSSSSSSPQHCWAYPKK